jgi:hypothetical protein
MRLDMRSRREILKANFEEYQRASKKGRKELLNRLVPVTGLNRMVKSLLSGGWPDPRGLISTRFLLLGRRPVSTGLIMRQRALFTAG